LFIPKEWAGQHDAFSLILDVIPQPKKITVIGFGNGMELYALHQQWPDAKIKGYEISSRKSELLVNMSIQKTHLHLSNFTH
jgi:trans-aconitate methyltransferase